MMTAQLGDYTLIRQLGRGSMGTAYQAEHRLMKRPYLIKVLPSELSCDPGFVQRFEEEVIALARLKHPHIVKIHTVSHAEGNTFLVTDLIREADNLAHYVRTRNFKLQEEEVLRIARQIASALDDAHQQEEPCAHGALKLNNILIQTAPEGIQAYLSDFGLSRIIGPAAVLGRTYQAVIDQLAANIGFSAQEGKYTPGPLDTAEASALHHSFLQNFTFLAPEQKKGIVQKGDLVKADVYAFGVLLYYLLLGEFPDGFFELPSLEHGYEQNWGLLLAHCLHKDPDKRPSLLLPVMQELLASSMPPVTRHLLSKSKRLGISSTAEEDLEGSYVFASATATLTQLKPMLKPREIARPAFEPDPGAIFQVETSVARYQPQPQEEKLIEPLFTPMGVIPSGSYFRGSATGGRDELPRHRVNLAAFALDIYPVTNEQFVRFLEVMGGEKDVNNSDIIRLRDARIKRSAGRLNIESGYAKHPVVGVTWYGAVAYAKWVGKRLPTEAEWEIASYGGVEENIYPTGQNIERSHANFFSADTTPVMSYSPNAYGLYDMAGNVYEWCHDWYDYHYYDHSVQEPDQPQGPLQGVYRVLRGGCWKSLKEDLRCAHRHRNNPGVMNGTYGFRCAADVSQGG